ncbi:hypothetical protein HYX70_04720 [Candidatus Saccharibacteria bacterium]|nr:hypothetical protein [Candidatus Saccharibacteria bacterium]
MDLNLFVQQNLWWLLLLTAWSLGWKGWALWRAAKLDQKAWFVVFMIVNTLGILEVFYVFYFSKQKTATKTASK